MNPHFNNEASTTDLIGEIRQLLFDATTRYQSDMESEKQALLSNCTDKAMINLVEGLTVTAFHTLDAIGRLQPTNSIEITKKIGIPKGTVSKNVKKLIEKKLITKKPLPDNKKESVLSITPLGEELYDLHKAFHQKLHLEFAKFFSQYETHDLELLVRVLKDFQNLLWIGSGDIPQ